VSICRLRHQDIGQSTRPALSLILVVVVEQYVRHFDLAGDLLDLAADLLQFLFVIVIVEALS
jgi:hypothetical protein